MNSASGYFRQAVEHFEKSSYQLAVEVGRKGLKHFPDDGRLWEIVGTSEWRLQRRLPAQEALETASCLIPLTPLAQFALACLYAQAGIRGLARLMLEHLARPDICPTTLLPKVATQLGKLGEYELALQACETLLDREPAHHGALFGIAYYKARLGCPPDELIPPLALAMDLSPNMLHYRINLALIWVDAGNPARAYDLLKEVPLEKIYHPCWLHKMIAVFDRFGDYDRCWTCMYQLDRAAETVGNETLPGDHLPDFKIG